MTQDTFGFVPFRQTVEAQAATITALGSFDEALAEHQARTARDGYVYPNLSWRASGELPQPWPLHRLPATHRIETTETYSREYFRGGMGAFIVHFFGFLMGRRCQFADWWVDGRISTYNWNGFELHREWEVRRSLDAAVTVWLALPVGKRAVAVNALFLHSRALSYFWDWERFQAEYQVLDSLFALAQQLLGKTVTPTGHAGRIASLIDTYELAPDAERVGKIVALRNDLVHESLWSEGMPTSSRDDFAFRAPFWLHRLNARLMLAIFRVPASVISSVRWGMGVHGFGMVPPTAQ